MNSAASHARPRGGQIEDLGRDVADQIERWTPADRLLAPHRLWEHGVDGC
jgi:hypothetical protein